MRATETIIDPITGGVEGDSGLGCEGWPGLEIGDGGTGCIEGFGGLRADTTV